MNPIKKLGGNGPVILAACGALGVAAAAFIFTNFSNQTVDGGYAAYVFSNPIFGAKEFKGVIKGPGGTGMVWRQDSFKISVTPYTMAEMFNDIRAKDQLKMTAEAYLTYRVDAGEVQAFVEEYGAITELSKESGKLSRSPEAITNDAYESFIRQPFRTEVRSAIASFNGLEAPSKIQEINRIVETNLKAKLKNTPFVIESVTIGSTTPPESVTAGITMKVAATQEYEHQAIKLDIAKRAEEIASAEGKAIANRVNQEAQGALLRSKAEAEAKRYAVEQEALADLARRKAEAEGLFALKKAEAEGMHLEAAARRAISDATGEQYIKLRYVEGLKDIKLPETLIISGSDANNGGILKILNIADYKSLGDKKPTVVPAP